MNINDVSKREILDFKQFLGKVMDNNYKPLDAKNQKDSFDRTGLHFIKREPAYDYVGYANAVFSPDKAGIDVPGYNATDGRDYVNAIGGVGLVQKITNALKANESVETDSNLKRLKDFKIIYFFRKDKFETCPFLCDIKFKYCHAQNKACPHSNRNRYSQRKIFYRFSFPGFKLRC